MHWYLTPDYNKMNAVWSEFERTTDWRKFNFFLNTPNLQWYSRAHIFFLYRATPNYDFTIAETWTSIHFFMHTFTSNFHTRWGGSFLIKILWKPRLGCEPVFQELGNQNLTNTQPSQPNRCTLFFKMIISYICVNWEINIDLACSKRILVTFVILCVPLPYSAEHAQYICFCHEMKCKTNNTHGEMQWSQDNVFAEMTGFDISRQSTFECHINPNPLFFWKFHWVLRNCLSSERIVLT